MTQRDAEKCARTPGKIRDAGAARERVEIRRDGRERRSCDPDLASGDLRDGGRRHRRRVPPRAARSARSRRELGRVRLGIPRRQPDQLAASPRSRRRASDRRPNPPRPPRLDRVPRSRSSTEMPSSPSVSSKATAAARRKRGPQRARGRSPGRARGACRGAAPARSRREAPRAAPGPRAARARSRRRKGNER